MHDLLPLMHRVDDVELGQRWVRLFQFKQLARQDTDRFSPFGHRTIRNCAHCTISRAAIDDAEPQLGDKLSEIKGRRYNLKKDKEERPLLSRVPLHATRLAFDHPETGERMEFEATTPKDLRATLNQLRKLG